MDVEFRDHVPESTRGGRGRPPRYQEFADALRQQPGRWGRLVPSNPNPTAAAKRMLAHHIRQGTYRALPPEEFTARTYQGEVWVCYIGKEKDDGS